MACLAGTEQGAGSAFEGFSVFDHGENITWRGRRVFLMEGSFYYEMGINRLRSAVAIFAVSESAWLSARGRNIGEEKSIGPEPLRVGLLVKSVARRVASARRIPRWIKSFVFRVEINLRVTTRIVFVWR